MEISKTIVCLANSRRPSGRCIAGRELTSKGFGEWIRPVSSRPGKGLSAKDRCFEDENEPELLDLISIRLKKAQPERHQQENYLIDDEWYWEKKGVLSWTKLQKAVEDPDGPLWFNDFSSINGRNDQVSEKQLDGISRSLYLLRPENLRMRKELEGGYVAPAKWKVRAWFKLAGYSYGIVVTDPLIDKQFKSKAAGEYPWEDALLCVSLGEVFNGFAYKLAAGVINKSDHI